MLDVIKSAVDLILPPKCAMCNRIVEKDKSLVLSNNNSPLCLSCESKLIPLPQNRRWFLCLSEPYSGDKYPSIPLYMPFTYGQFMQRAIPLVKFSGKEDLMRYCGMILGGLIKDDGIHADIIVPIPLSSSRLHERGYNQAQLLSESISSVTNIPTVPEILIRSKDTKRQTSIKDNTERTLNVEGAFEFNDSWVIDNQTIILVDDVATTGHTLHEAATCLMDNGAKSVLCVALCGNRAVKNAESY